MDIGTLLLQIFAVVVFLGLVTLAILAFIEPGPLERRSRTRRGQRPDDLSGDDNDQDNARG